MTRRDSGELILEKLAHPNIIGVHGKHESSNASNNSIVLATDFAEGGNLYEALYLGQKPVMKKPAAEKAKLMHQMASALAYLHDSKQHNNQHLVHLDLKPENFVFMDREQTEMKLIDFGQSRFLPPGQVFYNNAGNDITTITHQAPEAITTHDNYSKKVYYNEKMDIWSLGVIFHEMFFGMFLYFDLWIQTKGLMNHELTLQFDQFWKENHKKLMAKTKNCPTTHELSVFILEMLSPNPNRRPSADQVLAKLEKLQRDNVFNNADVALERQLLPNEIKQRWETSVQKKAVDREMKNSGSVRKPNKQHDNFEKKSHATSHDSTANKAEKTHHDQTQKTDKTAPTPTVWKLFGFTNNTAPIVPPSITRGRSGLHLHRRRSTPVATEEI